MKFSKNLFCLLFALLYIGTVQAQSPDLRAMPIPYYKEGQDKRLIIDRDPCYRTLQTLLKGAFRERGILLLDYIAEIEKIEEEVLKNSTPGEITDLILQNSSPDMQIKIDIQAYHNGKEHAYRSALDAILKNTSESCAATILDSGRRYYDDCYDLFSKAMLNRDLQDRKKTDVFIDQILSCQGNSQAVSLLFTLNGSMHNFNSFLNENGEDLGFTIKEWVKKHSTDGGADVELTPRILRITKVNIPLKDENGAPLSPNDFAYKLRKYLRGFTFEDDGSRVSFSEYNVVGNNINFPLD